MIIKINNLTKSFGDKKIFDNFTAEIDINGILVIKGASGLGKTTLLRIIAGLDKHYRGEIKKPDGEISFMFQEDRLIPFVSVLKNLAAVSNEETALRYLRLMGLESEKHSLPRL